MSLYYIIFEISVLLAVWYATCRIILWCFWDFSHLTLTYVSVSCLLLTPVLLGLYNHGYYASVVFNSPLLTLLCFNFIIVLTFFIIHIGFESLSRNVSYVAPNFFLFSLPSCMNFLILNVYILIHHYNCTDSLLSKLSSGLADYFFLSAVLTTAFYVSSLSMSVILTGVTALVLDMCLRLLVLIFNFGIAIFAAFVVTVITPCIGSFSGAIFVTWLACNKISSYEASAYLESILERSTLILAIPFAVLYICFVYKRYELCRSLCVFAVYNVAISAAVIWCVSATPLSKHAVPCVPCPEQDGYYATGDMAYMTLTSVELTHSHLMTPPMQTPPPQPEVSSPTPPPTSSLPEATQRCLEIDRNDQQAIKLSHLVYLEYLDEEGRRHGLKIANEIAASWKNLGRLFSHNVNEISSNHAMGADHAVNCCYDVLRRWFMKGQAQSYPLSWNGLVKALRHIDLNKVAADIERALNCVVEELLL